MCVRARVCVLRACTVGRAWGDASTELYYVQQNFFLLLSRRMHCVARTPRCTAPLLYSEKRGTKASAILGMPEVSWGSQIWHLLSMTTFCRPPIVLPLPRAHIFRGYSQKHPGCRTPCVCG